MNNQIEIKEDAKTRDDLIWNDKEKIYYHANGRKISQYQMLQLIRREQKAFNQDIDVYTRGLLNKAISFEDYQKLVKESVRDSHVQMMRLGRGGKERTAAIHYLDVANELRENQYPPLRDLFQQLADGKLSEAQLKARLKAYIKASKISFERGRESQQAMIKPMEVRLLGSTDRHCSDCIYYASRGIQPLGTLPVPGQACQCRQNCLCSKIFGTLEELVKRLA
jgi:hypothetical protein